MEAGVGHLEGAAGRGAAVGAVRDVGVVPQVVQLCVGQLFEVLAVGFGVLFAEHQRPHQEIRAGIFNGRLVGLLRNIVVVGKAHGNVVLVLVEHEAVFGVVVAPSVVRSGEEIFLLFGRGDEVFHAQQTPQGVVGDVRLTADIPLDAQCRVEAEDAGRGRAAEILQAALVEPEAEVVVGLVGIHAPVALGQVILELDGRGVLLHKVAVGVPLAELADADVYHAEHAGKGQHHCRHPTGKGPAPPPAAAEQAVQDKTADAEAQDGDILAGILQHTQRPFFSITVLHRHQGKRQRRDHQPADAPDRGVQLVGRDVGAFQRTGRHGAEDEHRHVVPPGVVAGIEGVEGAVEHRHQRKDGAGGDDALFAVALPGPPVGHRAGQTAQGQIGRHTRPLDDALRPDGGDVGRIGR